MKNCIIGQSGGPTAAINASLAGVIEAALQREDIGLVYGSLNGIEGVLKGRITPLNGLFEHQSQLDLLVQTPSSFLGACRYKLPEYQDDPAVYQQIFDFFNAHQIGFFFYIGGNDSMDTVDKLSRFAGQFHQEVRIIGVPKTIDNDLPCTDHTPGFGSAAKYIASTVKEIGRDSAVYDLDSVTIVEIMGRNAGWLTAASCLARTPQSPAPHLIYLPEVPFQTDLFLRQVKEKIAQFHNVMVCVSEGIRDSAGNYICEGASSGLSDIFGHKYLSGTAKVLENLVRDQIGCKARGVELNVSQRCASHFASLTDLQEAKSIGKEAVRCAAKGETGKMMAFCRQNDTPYRLTIEPAAISLAANQEKTVPPSWICCDGSDVTQEMYTYLLPLIQGELSFVMENGLPKHLVLPQA